ncbi:uncharacterized protein LOC128268168 [Anopheles cruzii]|uniref:uncharacterized protein LOC128268168 n=1 Tax=Anopheles cruzii TaxID=68878 RepID=UPI0022EC6F86|nr:uncharacterized protein LOC128268168 [Anopheles cruzii]
MKGVGYAVVLCALAAVQVKAAGDVSLEVPKKRAAFEPASGDTAAEKCTGDRIVCGSCTSVMVCSYGKENVGGYECSSVDTSRPYCTGKGVCSVTVNAACETESELCPAGNLAYPDPANCSEAVFCDASKKTVKMSSPTSNYVFNFTAQSWSLKKTAADCFQVNCNAAGQLNKWYAYKPDPRLSIFCGTSGPMIFECGENEVFVEGKKACEFACSKSGNFAYPGDTSRYYMCLPTATGGFQLFEQSCLPGLEFDDTKHMCVVPAPMIPGNSAS